MENRNERLKQFVDAGNSYSAAAREFSISPTTARQIYLKEARNQDLIDSCPIDLQGLSKRARTMLLGNGIVRKEQVIDLCESGTLKDIPHIGRKICTEVESFYGVQVKKDQPKRKNIRVTLKPEDSVAFERLKLKAEQELGYTLRDAEFAARVIQQYIRSDK